MPYFINPVETAECLLLRHEGNLSVVEALAACQEVGGWLAARRWNRLVVDLTSVQSVPKPMYLLALGQQLIQSLPAGARLALVVRPHQALHAGMVERVARRSGTFLAIFEQAEAAQAWAGSSCNRLKLGAFLREAQQPVHGNC